MSTTRKLARNDREWRALLHSRDRRVIRTAGAWKKLIASKKSPLAGIDKATVRAFTRSLKFKNGGFAHADYSMIASVVPFSRFRRIWEHFGMSLELFADHDGYECASRSTCKKMHERICTSNC
jgi:hypothetical protein